MNKQRRKMNKPDLSTVLKRRKRDLKHFFQQKIDLGLSEQDILNDVSVSYSLSEEAKNTLNKLLVSNKKENQNKAKNILTTENDTKAEENTEAVENVVEQKTDTTPSATTKRKKKKNTKPAQTTVDTEEADTDIEEEKEENLDSN